VIALADAGVPADDPALVRAACWLLDEEVRVAGDWALRRPDLEPGGWSFEFENDNYPDIDDTAEIVMALRKVDHPDRARVDAAIRRGVNWLVGMQSSNVTRTASVRSCSARSARAALRTSTGSRSTPDGSFPPSGVASVITFRPSCEIYGWSMPTTSC